jgi:hypothetical protein
MTGMHWRSWRRDLLVALIASVFTALALAPIAWAAVRAEREQAQAVRDQAEAARRQAEQMPAEIEPFRLEAAQDLRELFARFTGIEDQTEIEPLKVTTAAVTPEIPREARALIDRKAKSYAVGDIILYRVEDRNYLGRVVAAPKDGRLTVGRNGEANREIAAGEVVGRVAVNTR